jgi:hypothetical protein
LGLRGRRPDASKHHDGSQDSNGSPKTHLSLHAILLLVQRWFVEQIIEQEAKLGAATNFTARCCAGFVNLNVSPVKLTDNVRGRKSDFGLICPLRLIKTHFDFASIFAILVTDLRRLASDYGLICVGTDIWQH